MTRLLATLISALALVCALASVPAEGANAGTSGVSGVSAAQLDAYLAGKGSPMAGQGAALLASGGRWQVDPRLIVAIAGAESSFGAITCAPFNAWGYGCPNGPFRFESWADGIDTVAEGLRTNYLAEGRTSVALINLKYAPVGAANDPTGLNNNWTINVSRFLIELGGDPSDIDPAGVGGTRLLGLPGGSAGAGEEFGFQESDDAASGSTTDADAPDLTVASGAPRTLVVTVENTGTATWTTADVRLRRVDSEPRVVGAPYGALVDEAVAPGATAHFAVALAAAGTQTGVATTTWRLEGPGGPFGSELVRHVAFQVGGYVLADPRVDVEPTNGGIAGTTSTWIVVVHVRNAGSETWNRDGDAAVVVGKRAARGDLQPLGWVSGDVPARMLERRVEPGREASFAFRVVGEAGSLDLVLASTAGFAEHDPIVVRIGNAPA